MALLLLPFNLVRLFFQSISLAFGQIWTNKARSVLTTTGIVIGVASVVGVVAGLTGLEKLVLDEIETFGANRIDAWPARPETGPDKRVPWAKIRFKPEQVEGMLEYCPSLEVVGRSTGTSATVAKGPHKIEEVDVVGIDPAWHKIEKRAVTLGRPFSLIDIQEGKQVCLVPPDVRDRLFLDRDCVGDSILVGDRTYTIVGVVEPPLDFKVINVGRRDSAQVLVPFTTIYQRDKWLGVEALAKSPEAAAEAKAEITFFLRQRRGIQPGQPDNFQVETVQRVLEQFKGMSLAVTAVASGIVAISLVVGGVGIMNIMLVSVSERTREIGLRKALGARPSAIMFQFLIEAVMLCLVGGAAGLAMGQLITMGMANIPNFPLGKAQIPAWAVVLSFSFSSAVGLFFGLFPAVKAARLDPIEALRHE